MNQERSQQFMQKVVGDGGTAMAAALVLSGGKAGLFKAMAGAPGLGACWGPTRARALALAAGFESFVALPIRSPALAFYEVR